MRAQIIINTIVYTFLAAARVVFRSIISAAEPRPRSVKPSSLCVQNVGRAWLLFPAAFIVFFLITGCGGGGSGGGSGTGIDPIETEIRAVTNAFETAIETENPAAAQECLSPSLRYYRNGSLAWEDRASFIARLSSFFAAATVLSFEIRDLGINPNGETTASARGTLTCRYKDGSAIEHEYIEEIELQFERVDNWQITSISRYNLAGISFPPF